MEPDETPPKPTLKELLERYDVEGMETPFKEWFRRAIEQEYSVSPESVSIVVTDACFADTKKEKDKTCFKVGDLVRRIHVGTVGVITRVDEVMTNEYHGKKYLVTFQQDGKQVWLHADQLEHFGKHLPRVR